MSGLNFSFDDPFDIGEPSLLAKMELHLDVTYGPQTGQWTRPEEVPVEELHKAFTQIIEDHLGRTIEIEQPQVVKSAFGEFYTINFDSILGMVALLNQSYVVDPATQEIRKATSITEYGEYMEEHHRVGLIVLQNGTEQVRVSTVFLGMPHNRWSVWEIDGEQHGLEFFETMVFNHPIPELDEYKTHWRTLEEAQQGHQKIVDQLQEFLDGQKRKLLVLLLHKVRLDQAVADQQDELEENLFTGL